MVSNRPITGTPPDIEMMKMESFDPRPVTDRMPEMMPAAAHAAEIGTALLTPAMMARPIFLKSSAESVLVHTR